MMSLHHPRCQHYTPPPADPRFARFGEAMWRFITKKGGDFCGDELSEDILPLAQSAGLCCRVEYDPETHGEGIEADPGDEIWWWGDCSAERLCGGTHQTAMNTPTNSEALPLTNCSAPVYSSKPEVAAIELLDGAYDIIEIWKAESPSQKAWKTAWLSKARELGANPSW